MRKAYVTLDGKVFVSGIAARNYERQRGWSADTKLIANLLNGTAKATAREISECILRLSAFVPQKQNEIIFVSVDGVEFESQAEVELYESENKCRILRDLLLEWESDPSQEKAVAVEEFVDSYFGNDNDPLFEVAAESEEEEVVVEAKVEEEESGEEDFDFDDSEDEEPPLVTSKRVVLSSVAAR